MGQAFANPSWRFIRNVQHRVDGFSDVFTLVEIGFGGFVIVKGTEGIANAFPRFARRTVPEPADQFSTCTASDDPTKDYAGDFTAQHVNNRLRIEAVIFKKAKVVAISLPAC